MIKDTNSWADGYRQGFRDGLEEASKQKPTIDVIDARPKIPTQPPNKWPPSPDRPPQLPHETGVVCPKCGVRWSGAMLYCCHDSNCPVQPKIGMKTMLWNDTNLPNPNIAETHGQWL